MQIVVLIKRVPDTASAFAIASDGKSVETAGLKYVMSPFDEYAVEEAIRIREAQGSGEVVILSAGAEETKETLRQALAMGADRAVLVADGAIASAGPRGVAVVLAAALKKMQPDLVFAGKQAVDDDASQVAERVAELIEWPHASLVSKFALHEGKALVAREIEGGRYNLEVPLPALFTIEKGINTPRYPTLPNIMKAKKKEIAEYTLADLGVDAGGLALHSAVESLALPRQDRLTKILSGDTAARVKQLVACLRDDEKAL